MRLPRRRTVIAARPAADTSTPAQIQGTTGWKPFGQGQHASDQIGAYAGTVLTQYPVNLPGVQRHCGVESMRSNWYTPTRSAIPLPERQTVAAPSTFIAGRQRAGQTFTGPQGPIGVRLMRQRVSAAAQDQTQGSMMLPPGLTQPLSD